MGKQQTDEAPPQSTSASDMAMADLRAEKQLLRFPLWFLTQTCAAALGGTLGFVFKPIVVIDLPTNLGLGAAGVIVAIFVVMAVPWRKAFAAREVAATSGSPTQSHAPRTRILILSMLVAISFATAWTAFALVCVLGW